MRKKGEKRRRIKNKMKKGEKRRKKKGDKRRKKERGREKGEQREEEEKAKYFRITYFALPGSSSFEEVKIMSSSEKFYIQGEHFITLLLVGN